MSLWVQESNPAQAATSILFLHGLGVSSWMWQAQVAVLQAQFHCMTIDLPGNGESHQVEWRSFQETAAQVADIIRQRTVKGKAHVVGLSLGGYAGLALLEHQPEVVDSLIVSGVVARPFPQPWLWRTMATVIAQFLHWKPLIYANASAMQLPAEVIPLFMNDMRRLSKTTFLRTYNELLKYQLPATFAQRTQRLLAVAGDKEVAQIRATVGDFAKRLPNGKAALVPNAHHGWNGEHPELFTTMVRAWVENKPLPAALNLL